MTTRAPGTAPMVTLVVSFAIVFGLGWLIGPAIPAPQPQLPPPPLTTTDDVFKGWPGYHYHDEWQPVPNGGHPGHGGRGDQYDQSDQGDQGGGG